MMIEKPLVKMAKRKGEMSQINEIQNQMETLELIAMKSRKL